MYLLKESKFGGNLKMIKIEKLYKVKSIVKNFKLLKIKALKKLRYIGIMQISNGQMEIIIL